MKQVANVLLWFFSSIFMEDPNYFSANLTMIMQSWFIFGEFGTLGKTGQLASLKLMMMDEIPL